MTRRKKNKVNKCLLVSFILGVVYSVYIAQVCISTLMESQSGAEALGVGIGMYLIAPHLVCVVLATVFNGLGVFLKQRWFALVGAILYTVAIVMFLPGFLNVTLQMILSYIGFAQLTKRKKSMEVELG